VVLLLGSFGEKGRKGMKKVLAWGCLLFLPITVWADGNNYGAASYLREGAGARASGMGGAFVAIADDATAGYWNPAGLSQMELNEYQAALEYAFLPNNLSTSFVSYAFALPEIGNFSLDWMNFSEGSLEGRDASGNVLPDFNAAENTFFLSYGRKFYGWAKGLSLGANLKVLQQTIGSYSAVGPGLDIAALWQPVMAWDHTLGVNVQNLFQREYWNSTNTTDYSQVNVKAGMALKFFRSEDELYFNRLITALDLEFSEYSRFNLRAGVEYWYLSNMGIRAGYNGQEVTAGASYRPEHFEIDYAFHYDLSDVGAHQHRLSLLLRFGADDSAQKKADAQAEPVEPTPALVEPVVKPDEVFQELPADVMEIQRSGGRASKVIMNKGGNQGVKVGMHGTLLDTHGSPLGVFTIIQVDPALSLAEVNSLGHEIDNNVRAVIKLPQAK
jgi:hypothetical protein